MTWLTVYCIYLITRSRDAFKLIFSSYQTLFNLRIKLSFTCQGSVVINRQVENYQPPCSRNCAQSPESKSLLLCTYTWGSQMIYLCDLCLPWPEVKIPVLTIQDLSRFSTTLGSWTHQRTVFIFKTQHSLSCCQAVSVETKWISDLTNIHVNMHLL